MAAGQTHEEYFKDGFHERLAENWPEPREQLHAGGAAYTDYAVEKLALGGEAKVLDLCCGEGATAVYLAKKGINVTGIDIVGAAIAVANERAQREGVEARFVAGNAFSMPFADGEFDAVLGQDPDAFAHPDRVPLFKEILRVLKPGGRLFMHHHWIAGADWTAEQLKEQHAANAAAGLDLAGTCSFDSYVADCKAAGFAITTTRDITEIASKHLRGCADIAKSKNDKGEVPDPWLRQVIAWLDEGRKMGVEILATKPE